MSHTAFGEFFPEIADKETRVVTIIDQAITGLPLGAYALIDLYCTDPDCDCRNVYIHVVHKGFPSPIATITYGWEKLSYYKKWMGGEEDDYILRQSRVPHWRSLRGNRNLLTSGSAFSKISFKQTKHMPTG